MINEIKKLYKNVGLDNLWVERYNDGNGFEHENWYPSYKVMIKSMMEKNGWALTEARNVAKKECHKELLPFTAEKQIELIKWLIIEGYIEDMLTVQISEENFEACLADTFNELWQDLTEEEKQQIKKVLE